MDNDYVNKQLMKKINKTIGILMLISITIILYIFFNMNNCVFTLIHYPMSDIIDNYKIHTSQGDDFYVAVIFSVGINDLREKYLITQIDVIKNFKRENIFSEPGLADNLQDAQKICKSLKSIVCIYGSLEFRCYDIGNYILICKFKNGNKFYYYGNYDTNTI